MDATLAVGTLHFLLDLYSVFRKRAPDMPAAAPDPKQLEELIGEIEGDSETSWDERRMEKRIDEKFSPEDAGRVKRDITWAALITDPPVVERFDYWSLLGRYVRGLQALANMAHLFRLRGRTTAFGPAIELRVASTFLLPPDRARQGIVPRSREAFVKIDAINAYLIESTPQGFPISIVVSAVFQEFGITGYDSPTVFRDSATYAITSGQQPHWLRFKNDQGKIRFEDFEFMLNASDLTALIDGLRIDVQSLTEELHKDMGIAEPLFKEVEEFLKKIG